LRKQLLVVFLLGSLLNSKAATPLQIAQQAYLKASNTGAGDNFGVDVAVSGDTVVVGAWWEDSRATGVNGNQASNSSRDSGAAYIFVRKGTNWTQQAYLKSSNGRAGDLFGRSVAISGDTVVVGAPQESGGFVQYAGAAYVFVRSGTNWSEQGYLKASNADAADYFGYPVAVAGNTVVVGAYGEASSAIGVNGEQTDNSAQYAGAAYVFVRSGATWRQQAYLKPSNTRGFAFFSTVAVSGSTVVVGAGGETSTARGVNGDQTDNGAQNAGAVYVFVRDGTNWSQQAYLKASNSEAGDGFGGSVAISGDTLVVGAVGESSNATTVNGNQSDNSAPKSGAAYVFVRKGTNWNQQAYLKAPNAEAGDYFGISVSVSGDRAVVGAYGESSIGAGNPNDNSASRSGAAYVFARDSTNWSPQIYLKANNAGAGDWFGFSVGLSGDTVIAGALYEASNATGIDGDSTNDGASQSGAAYVFVVPPINHAPVAASESVSLSEDSSLTIALSASDVDGDPLTYTIVAPPIHGVLTDTGGNRVYTPAPNYNGPDSFTFKVNDGQLDSAPATVNIQVISVNDAPVAVARIVPLFVVSTNQRSLTVLSVNDRSANVILDASLSYDIEGDPLEFSWFAGGSPSPFAVGESVTAILDVGEHVITLVVSDGTDQGTDTLRVQVITACEAVGALMFQVDQADLPRNNKMPLLTTLRGACASFDRGELRAASNQLHAFQNKVRAQIEPGNPQVASDWIHVSQEIIDAAFQGARE